MANVRATTPIFKPIAGGYIYRAPNPCALWRLRFYRVNEAQKAALLAILAAPGLHRARGAIFLLALTGLVFAATMGLAYVSGDSQPSALDAIVLLGLLPLYIYGALVISILPLALRLAPVLKTLPPHPPVSLRDWGRPLDDGRASQKA